MQIVIDVPYWLYNVIMECKEPNYSKSLGEAVRDGTPLPKYHGRLIDADALLRKHPEFDTYTFPSTTINNAPTIIPATKEGE